ncbi:MAG: aminoacetone oxidase family FAD-binding enzyme [Candidatus Gracilibacteria bacterium]|nr:aminoacetone oxidase family FAD-binding enzyme [Candidatus Gracilibacteria bacterium]
MKIPKIAIIGAGAAGLMCAASLIEENTGAEIHLFEKNTILGSKVIISGGGRCNVTTGIRDKKELLSKYTRGSQFLKSAIGKFPPEKVYEWFEKQAVPLKTEKDQRVFPVSNDGKDIVRVFEKLFQKHEVKVHYKESVQKVMKAEDNQIDLRTDQDKYLFDYVVLTTGGNAYQHTGSTGDGYSFAKNFGHTVTPLGPSLNSFMTAEEWPKSISGLALPNAKLEAQADDGKTVKAEGPILFTHFGISGPALFALSSHLSFSKISNEHPIQISISARAEKSFQDWDKLIHEETQRRGAQQFQTFLKKHLQNRLVELILEQLDIEGIKKNSELSKIDRERVAHLLTGHLTLNAIKRRPGDEFVTAGGIVLDEINKKTMQSKLHSGLFFGGEIMNVDGVTGGFNLQASWATGRLAGKSIASMLNSASPTI